MTRPYEYSKLFEKQHYKAEDALLTANVTLEELQSMSPEQYSDFRGLFMNAQGSIRSVMDKYGIGPNEVELTQDKDKEGFTVDFGFECYSCGEFFNGFESRGASLVAYKKHKLECEEQ